MTEQFPVKIGTYEKNGMFYIKIWHKYCDVTIGFDEDKQEYLNSVLLNLEEIILHALDEHFIETKFYEQIDTQLEKWAQEN